MLGDWRCQDAAKKSVLQVVEASADSKVMSFATSWQVLAAFVVTYSSPYLLASPGLDLGAKVGWIFFVISCFCVIFIVFFVPELRGRS